MMLRNTSLCALLLGLIQFAHAQVSSPDWLQGQWQTKSSLMLMGMAFEEQIALNISITELVLHKTQRQGFILSEAERQELIPQLEVLKAQGKLTDLRTQELYEGILGAALTFSCKLPLTAHHPWDKHSGYFVCGTPTDFDASSTHLNPPIDTQDLVQIRWVQYQRLPGGQVRFVLQGDDNRDPKPEEMRREDAFRFVRPQTAATHAALPKAGITPENIADWIAQVDAFLQSPEIAHRRKTEPEPDRTMGVLAGSRQEMEFIYDFFVSQGHNPVDGIKTLFININRRQHPNIAADLLQLLQTMD
ncbi:hypothetical protein [Eisenibacter elegans]|uniref:hypothetical protein n=1 Tax=Eisenibacter elegans TaxID=997 RepID=UPI00040308BC|nr:hypothetical protein [Eisenibacter elegans]